MVPASPRPFPIRPIVELSVAYLVGLLLPRLLRWLCVLEALRTFFLLDLVSFSHAPMMTSKSFFLTLLLLLVLFLVRILWRLVRELDLIVFFFYFFQWFPESLQWNVVPIWNFDEASVVVVIALLCVPCSPYVFVYSALIALYV